MEKKIKYEANGLKKMLTIQLNSNGIMHQNMIKMNLRFAHKKRLKIHWIQKNCYKYQMDELKLSKTKKNKE